MTSTFYQLTPEEWLRARAELKPAEKDLFFYLKTLHPFGDRPLDISMRALAEVLGMAASTVSRGLHALAEKGWINLEIVAVRVRLLPQDAVADPEPCCPQESDVAPTQPVLPTDNGCCLQATVAAAEPSPETIAEQEVPGFSTDVAEPTRSNRSFKPSKQGAPHQKIRAGAQHTEDKKAGLVGLVEQFTGIHPNRALQAVIAKFTPEEAHRRIVRATASFNEQRHQVRNPQAFLSAAIQRNFSSNQAKQTPVTPPSSPKRKNNPLAPVAADLSDLIAEISIHCRRLNISTQEAIARFGRPGRSLSELNDLDVATLRLEIARW